MTGKGLIQVLKTADQLKAITLMNRLAWRDIGYYFEKIDGQYTVTVHGEADAQIAQEQLERRAVMDGIRARTEVA